MTRLRRARAGLLALLLATLPWACGREATPEAVVAQYFARLGRDPLGTLPLLSDAFHGAHGLRVTTRQRARALRAGAGDEGLPGAPQPIDTPGEISRARLGWVAIQKREPVRGMAEQLRVETLSVRQEGDTAEVSVRVEAPALPAFVQRFRLSRTDGGSAWRIDAVSQEEVAPPSRRAAMAAWPSRERMLEILRAGR